MGKVENKQKINDTLLEEYNTLLARFEKAFDFRYDEDSKADIEFRRIIKRLSELQELINGG